MSIWKKYEMSCVVSGNDVCHIRTCCCACRYVNDNLATLLEHYTDVDVAAPKLEWLSMRGLLLEATSCSSEVFYQIHPSITRHVPDSRRNGHDRAHRARHISKL